MSEWVSIPGYEGRYEACRDGRVRSVDRLVPAANRYGPVVRRLKGRILRPGWSKRDGYGLVALGAHNNQKIHSVIAATFIGPRPAGLDINHIDGDKRNNAVDNLEYVTTSANLKHAFRTGLKSHCGEGSPTAKLKERDVLAIRASSLSAWELSEKYQVSRVTIYKIRSRDLWKHI